MTTPIASRAVPIAPRTTAADARSPVASGGFADRLAAARAANPVATPAGTPVVLAPSALAGASEPITAAGRQLLTRLVRGEHALDNVVRQALAGRSYTQADLLALQAQVYQHTQSLDLLSKIADRAANGVKTILSQGA